jgi:H+/Cl- antiporter ClcA
MSATDWAALIVAVMTILGGFVTSVRWLVKHYLSELRPNGGSSVKDQVNRLESRVDQIYLLLCEKDQQ